MSSKHDAPRALAASLAAAVSAPSALADHPRSPDPRTRPPRTRSSQSLRRPSSAAAHGPRGTDPAITTKPNPRSLAMRHRLHLSLLVCAALAAPVGWLAPPSVAVAAGPATETVYIQGRTAEINTAAAVIFDASLGLLDQASPIYVIEFPVAAGTTGTIALPSGYQPQHNGFPPSPIPYHDHVLASAPGLGSAGTAGRYTAPLRVVAMRYSWAYAYSPAFVPITSADQIPGAEAAGELEVISPGASDPYQLWTTTVLVRPVLPER